MRGSHRWLLLVASAFLVLLAGCKVDATVTVKVHDDGSGVVTTAVVLDADAVKGAEAGGGKLEDRVRVADLTAAGWTVRPWVRAADGSAVLSLSKKFANPAEATAILGEVSGAVGPLQGMKVTRDHGMLSTKYSVTGTIDLAKLGSGVTGDQALVQSLTGQHVDVNAIDQSLLAEARDALSLQVVAALPNGTTTVVKGQAGKATPIDASTSVRDTKRVGLLVLAIVLVVAAVFVLLWPGRRRRGRDRGRGRGRGRGEAPASAPPTTRTARRGTPPAS